MTCPNCGKEIMSGATFCPECGAKLLNEQVRAANNAAAGEKSAQESITAEQLKATIQNKTNEIRQRAMDIVAKLNMTKIQKISFGCSLLAVVMFLFCITGEFIDWLMLLSGIVVAFFLFKKKEHGTIIFPCVYSLFSILIAIILFDASYFIKYPTTMLSALSLPVMIAVSVIYWLTVTGTIYERRLGSSLVLLGNSLIAAENAINIILAMAVAFRSVIFFIGVACEFAAYSALIYSDEEVPAFIKAVLHKEIKLKDCIRPKENSLTNAQYSNSVHNVYSESYLKKGNQVVCLLMAVIFILIGILNYVPAVYEITEDSILSYSGGVASSLLTGTENTASYYESRSIFSLWSDEDGIGAVGTIIGAIYTIIIAIAAIISAASAFSSEANGRKRNRWLLDIANESALAVNIVTYLLVVSMIGDGASYSLSSIFAILLILISANFVLLKLMRNKFKATTNA